MSAVADVCTQPVDLDAADAWLLDHDPEHHEHHEPLLVVGPSPDDQQDAEDAALIAASSTGMRGAPGRIGSPYTSSSFYWGDISWHSRAECREAPADDADQLTEARSQAEAERVIADYCSGCPVIDLCLREGRQTRAWGVAGGVVLVDGRKAAQHRPGAEPTAGSQDAAQPASPRERAVEWLADQLAQRGSLARRTALLEGQRAGHGTTILDRAAKELKVTRRRDPSSSTGILWSLPTPELDVEQVTEEATQGAALWLIDTLDHLGPQPPESVLQAAPYSRGATLAGARLLDLDPDTEIWRLP